MAVLGFFVTGLFFYPYGIIRDSQTTMVAVLSESGGGGEIGIMGGEAWKRVNNWMGWVTPYLWKLIRSFTGLDYGIGLFHNLAYWVAMPILFLNLFPHRGKSGWGDAVWFVPVAFFPPMMIFLVNITNNVLLLSLLLLAGAILSLGTTPPKMWIAVGVTVVLLMALGVRRDAFLFIFPFTAILGFYFTRRLLFSATFTFSFILLAFGLDKAVTSRIDGYHYGINSPQLLWLFDLTGMSNLEQRLLIPEQVLNDKLRGHRRGVAMEAIGKLPDIYNDRYFYHGFEITDYPYWFNGLTLKEVAPVYLRNFHTYLRFRAGFAKAKLFRHPHESGSGLPAMNHPYLFDGDIAGVLGYSEHPIRGFTTPARQEIRMLWSHTIEKLAPFLFQPWFYLLLTAGCLVSLRSLLGREESHLRWLLLSLITLCWVVIAVLWVGGVSVQLRYEFPYLFFIWIISLYCLRRLTLARSGVGGDGPGQNDALTDARSTGVEVSRN